MTPDDPRHGTIAGYVHHVRIGQRDCDPCRRAKMRYEKERILSGPRKVPAIGTRRRIQALRALGYSLAELAAGGGWQTEHAAFKYPMTAETITATTAARVADLYEQLCMTPATGPRANRLRILARRNNWMPPLFWDDIDLDPDPALDMHQNNKTSELYDFDEVTVIRILEGDWNLCKNATVAERREVTARWTAAGRGANELARLTGWKVERYYQDTAA